MNKAQNFPTKPEPQPVVTQPVPRPEPQPVQPRPEPAYQTPPQTLHDAIGEPNSQLAPQRPVEPVAAPESPLQPIQRQLDEQMLEPPRPEPVAPAQVVDTPAQVQARQIQELNATQPKLTPEQVADINAQKALADAPTEAMMQEARKYKSAEEFGVKGQNYTTYHPEDVFENDRMFKTYKPSESDSRYLEDITQQALPADSSIRYSKVMPTKLLSGTEKTDPTKVAAMVKAIKNGEELPPIIVENTPFTKNGKELSFTVFDGHNRLEAYKKAGVKDVKTAVIVNAEDYSAPRAQQLTDLYNQAHTEAKAPKAEAPDPLESLKQEAKRFGYDKGYTEEGQIANTIDELMKEQNAVREVGIPLYDKYKSKLHVRLPILRQQDPCCKLRLRGRTKLGFACHPLALPRSAATLRRARQRGRRVMFRIARAQRRLGRHPAGGGWATLPRRICWPLLATLRQLLARLTPVLRCGEQRAKFVDLGCILIASCNRRNPARQIKRHLHESFLLPLCEVGRDRGGGVLRPILPTVLRFTIVTGALHFACVCQLIRLIARRNADRLRRFFQRSGGKLGHGCLPA